jgi:DUF971 family protein
MKPIPSEIRSTADQLSIQWSDGHQSRYVPRELRLACRCAACIDEWTQEQLVNTHTVPGQVKPKSLDVVGNYALHIDWTDGHNTGIYTYDYLRQICACDTCRAPRSFDV